MATYTIADIQALRERTGAGMMDVKKALDEAAGDSAKALEIIRVKGLQGVSSREGRAASDGLIAIAVNDGATGQVGTMVEVNSETDFVAKNDTFLALADRVLGVAVATGGSDLDALLAADAGGTALGEVVNETAATLGEKLVVRRVVTLTGDVVSSYLHRTSKDLPPQVGVLVASDAAGAEVARDVAMHIAAFSPTYLTREDVPADIVAGERSIAEETAKNEGRPEQAMPKIIEGRLNGFFKENVLLEQAFAKDTKKTVGQIVSEAGATITGFDRFRVGA